MSEKHPTGRTNDNEAGSNGKPEKIGLHNLGEAMAAHEATKQEERREEMQKNVPFTQEAKKAFSPETTVPAHLARGLDEPFPAYRDRLKSTLKTSVAGVEIGGIDTSKFSVKVPRTNEKVKSRRETIIDAKLERNFTDSSERRAEEDFDKHFKATDSDTALETETVSKKDRKRPSARDHAENSKSREVLRKGGEVVPLFKAREGKAKVNENLEYLGPIPSAKKSNLASAMEAARAKSGVADAQDAYFTELKKYQKERSILGVAAENFTGELSTKNLKELRRKWVRSRAALARTQLESVDERLKSRTTSPEQVLKDLKNYKGKGHFTPEEIKARYERLVTIRSTVLGAEEAEDQARIEGLSSREKGRFDSAYNWYKSQPKWARIVGTSALLFAGSAGLATLAGAGVAVSAVAFAGSRTGARVLAETKKGTHLGTSAAALSKMLAVGALVGIASEAVTRVGHKIAGTERSARELLAKKEKLGDLANEESFTQLSKARKDALGAKERVARHGRLARTLGSLTGGMLFGHAIHGHDAAGSHDGAGAEGVTNSVAPGEVQPGGAHTEELAIHGKVYDADRLFGHFRDQLAKEYGDVSKAPPAIRTFIEHTGSQDDLTKWLGFQGKDGLSAMMHEGDTVSVQPDGSLAFTAGGETHTIIDAQGTLHKFDLTKFHTTQIEHPHHETQTAAHAAVKPETKLDTATSKTTPERVEISSDAPASSDASSAATDDDSKIEYPPESEYIYKPEGEDPSVGTTPGLIPAEGEPGAVTGSVNGIGDLTDLGTGHTDVTVSSSAGEAVSMPSGSVPDSRGIGDLSDLPNPDTGAADILTNIHNVPLSLNDVHEYVWKLPNTDTERLFAFGGTPEASAEMAHEFAATNPPGSVMFFVTEKHNLLGIDESHVSAWFTNEKGQAEFVDNALDSTGKALPVPKTDDFTRLIK